jgi:hypothetical protein
VKGGKTHGQEESKEEESREESKEVLSDFAHKPALPVERTRRLFFSFCSERSVFSPRLGL